jgi:hypothetical protein
MAVFWGMFAYSLVVLGLVTGLSIKVALLFKDRGILRAELGDAERDANETRKALKLVEDMIERYRNEIKELNDELDADDRDLVPSGVADRLKRLLSGEVSEDDREDGEGGDPVSATPGTGTSKGDV